MSSDEDFGDDGGSYDIPRNDGKTKPTDCYDLLTVEQLFAQPTPKWLAKGVIRLGEIGALYGPPSCGKTFVAVDIALHVIEGAAWWKHRTTQGSVLYLAGEGSRGLKRRVQAWCIEHGVEPKKLNLRVLPHSIRFLEPDNFERLVRSIAGLSEQPVLIVIDTLARYFDGEENSAKEMGRFVDLATKLRDITGATILIVHHEGKAQKGLRGSSALHGAVDVAIQVKRDESGLITITGEKTKDDLPLEPHYFKPWFIDLGVDEHGDEAGSLVLRQGEKPAEEQADAKPGDPPPAEPFGEPDNGAVIRRTLATMFNGRASGGALKPATRLPDSTYYDALEAEIEAKRIRAGDGRYPIYELTNLAKEYRSPSPSPSPESRPDSDSAHPDERESESESDTTPLGVSADSDSDSRRSAQRKGATKKAKKKTTSSTGSRASSRSQAGGK